MRRRAPRLAYSTIAALGTLVMLVGLDGPAAAYCYALILLVHALYKSALFFVAGIMLTKGQVSRR